MGGKNWANEFRLIVSGTIPALNQVLLSLEKHPGPERKWKTFIWIRLIEIEPLINQQEPQSFCTFVV